MPRTTFPGLIAKLIVLFGGHYTLFIIFLFPGSEGVLHQRADGHRPYTTWNRRDKAALGTNLIKLHIAVQTEATLAGGIGYTGGTYVDDDGTVLNHIGGDKVGLSDSCDDNVGLAALLLQRLGMRVADGDSGVAILLLHHELGHGLANDILAAEDDTLLTAGLDIIALQQGNDAEGSG